MKSFLVRWFITTLAVFLAAQIVHGIDYGGNFGTLLAASLLLGILNALVRPVLMLFSLPLIIVTMGFFILLINALLLKFTGLLIPGFEVHGFWAAFFGAIIISIVSWALNGFIRKDGRTTMVSREPSMKRVSGRVIDV